MTPQEVEIETLNLLMTEDPEGVKRTYAVLGEGIEIVVDEVSSCVDENTTAEDVLIAFQYLANRFKEIGAL